MLQYEIIICTERGPLEPMAELLIKTIRNYGGFLRQAPIYSYQPRRLNSVLPETRAFFEANQVSFVDEPLNEEWKDYPLANKPLVCAYHEQTSQADVLIFLDTDTFFLAEPTLFSTVQAGSVLMRPVDFNNVGALYKFRGKDGNFWSKLYELLEVNRYEEVMTTVDQQRILEYYNSGMIVVHRKTGLFQRWCYNFRLTMQKRLMPSDGLFFVEQSVLSATIAQMDIQVDTLNKNYNYPVSAYAKKWRGFYPYSLKKVVHVHYHKLFQSSSNRNLIRSKLDALPNGAQVNEWIRSGNLI